MTTALTDDEVVRRGQQIYARQIAPRLEPGDRGKFVIVNVETGDFEIDADDLAASRRAKERFEDAPLFTLRVGHPAAYRLGGASSGR